MGFFRGYRPYEGKFWFCWPWHRPVKEKPDAMAYLAERGDFSLLIRALELTGLDAALVGADEITLFAPNDAAFGRLAVDLGYRGDRADGDAVFTYLVGALGALGDPVDILSSILTYHVAADTISTSGVARRDEIETLNGASLAPDGFKLGDGAPSIADAQISDGNNRIENGLVHVIDRILLPIDLPYAGGTPIVIEAEDMVLDGYEVEQDDDATGGALIKLNHRTGTAEVVFDGPAGTYDIEVFYFDESDGRARIRLFVDDERVLSERLDMSPGGRTATAENRASVLVEDIVLDSGAVLKLTGKRNWFEFARIDRIEITPRLPETPSILDIATGDPAFSILVDALDATGLTDTIAGLTDATVFAPTNAAFAALAVDLGFTGDGNDADAVLAFLIDALTGLGGGDFVPVLTDILLYHVAPGGQTAADLDAAIAIQTSLADATIGSLGTELLDNDPSIANPVITGPDVEASNGFVQVIDRVLLPDAVVDPAPIPSPVGYITTRFDFGPDAPDEITDVTYAYTINTVGEEQNGTFWSNQFFFTNSSQDPGNPGALEGGYMGVQQLEGGTDLALFSIFVAEEGRATNPDAFVVDGSELGETFVSVRLNIDLQAGVEYAFTLSEANDPTGDWWSVGFTVDGGDTIELGDIRVDDAWGGITPNIAAGFMERFGDSTYDGCDSIRFSETVFQGGTTSGGLTSTVEASVTDNPNQEDCSEQIRKRTDFVNDGTTATVTIVDADLYDFG